MGAFDNCRICLCEINHEPIKITRLILRFLEKCLQLTNVTKPYPLNNVKQNLCAPCFNKISEFQDFYEQCKDSDEFWKAQFDDLKEVELEEHLTFEQTVLLPLTEDSNSLEADTTVSIEEKSSMNFQSVEKKQHNVSKQKVATEQDLQQEIEKIEFSTSSLRSEDDEEEAAQIESFDLTNWPDDTNDDDGQIQILKDDNRKYINEEIIEYEYQIEEGEEIEIEKTSTIDDNVNAETLGVDYRLFAYEKIATSSESTAIHETIEKAIEQSETKQNSFFMSETIDENGKVKMSYKCQYCDKSFNRIYDINSHYNIHNGVKPFVCYVCGKSFRQKNILTTHQTLHFGKKVECAECGKKFARRSQLILHYRMHRDEKPFMCNFEGCQAAFRQRKQLIDHSFIHTDEKNFQCATCTKSFHTRKRLQDHIYKVHSQHRYCCELCEKAFLKPHMLKHHMITAHKVEVDDVSHLKTSVDVLKSTKRSSRHAIEN